MLTLIVGSVNRITVTERIFGMRGLRGLTINSGRGTTLKYLYDGHKSKKKKWRLFRQKSDYLSFYTTQKGMVGVEIGRFRP